MCPWVTAARPMKLMTLNVTYNSALASNNINFVDFTSDNISVNLNHTLKWYFNYSCTYARSSFRASKLGAVNSLALSANYRISNSLALLSTYLRRNSGRAGSTVSDNIDESISNQIMWQMSRRASLRLNHQVSGLGSDSQSYSYGGNLAVNF